MSETTGRMVSVLCLIVLSLGLFFGRGPITGFQAHAFGEVFRFWSGRPDGLALVYSILAMAIVITGVATLRRNRPLGISLVALATVLLLGRRLIIPITLRFYQAAAQHPEWIGWFVTGFVLLFGLSGILGLLSELRRQQD